MPPESVSTVELRFLWLQRFWALLGLALIVFTWNLWTPQTVFPQIPFFSFLVNVPGAVDWILLVLTLVSLCGVLVFRRTKRIKLSLVVFAVSASLLVLLDQHRLQPWMYQFIVYAVVMSCCSARSAMAKLRWITVSVYLFSALSKFDFQFAETLGIDFLETLVGFVGIDPVGWPKWLVAAIVLAFPAFEFIAGIGLIWRFSRRVAIGAIIAMHLLLLLILGPLGLNHQWGVLVWNVFLLGQAIMLFGWIESQSSSIGEEDESVNVESANSGPAKNVGVSRQEQFALVLVVVVLLAPLSVSAGVIDHWQGWEVYAPRSSRTKLEVFVGEQEQFGEELKEFLSSNEETDQFVRFDLERWSLETLQVPINPQARIQFAVASHILDSNNLRSFRISVGGISDRFTGAREWEVIERTDRLKMKASEFWLNTKVRRLR